MEKILSNKYLLLFSRFVLALVFLYAGVEKIINPADFSNAISNYKLFPNFLINIFAITIPWIELIAALLLMLGIRVRENSFIFSLLLILFVAIIFVSIIRGLNIDCGCFGTASGTKVGFSKIAENIFLFFLGIHLIRYNSKVLALKTEE